MAIDLQTLMLVAPIAGAISLILAAVFARSISGQSAGNEKMRSISSAIHEGAMAYLNRQNKTIAMFAIVILAIFLIIGATVDKSWFGIGISFVVGAVFSALAGFIGMKVTTSSNSRTAEAARKGLNAALMVSFRAGMVMGLAVVGLALLGVSSLIYLFDYTIKSGMFASADSTTTILQLLTGMGFGASLVAMFARVGGGIYTKGADVGADLVGKVEAGIPEDDPRNPAVIADNVGDNVGDCAGMGADLFESYIVTIIGAMILGNIVYGLPGVILPLVIGGAAVFAALIGSLFVRTKENGDALVALNNGIIATALISAVIFYFVTQQIIPDTAKSMGIFLASLVGLAVAILIVYVTDYFTSTKHRPVRSIAEAAQTGAGTNVIQGLAVGLESTAPIAIIIVIGILAAFYSAGIYGIAIAAMALLSLTVIIVAVDTFGPVSDNAGGIAEMSGLPPEVRKITDKLDAVGNTTKATTKGFAICSAGLAALALLLAFAQEVNTQAVLQGVAGLPTIGGTIVINILDPKILAGMLIGGALPFFFSAFTMRAVGNAAKGIVEEVRRQFKEKKGIMAGTEKPDYAKCVDICASAGIRELIVPGIIVVVLPLLVGFVLGVGALGGFLAGALITAQFMAIFMSNSGGAWDNAKKYIEVGNLGGKGSVAHKAAVVGDTVGDPLKDTSGPALNPMIKILNTISILFVALIVKFALKI
ncbi:K(+)-stimulated pyrophosphate-energized sodium pump [Candidatus Gugararchaeum adminiculabundum]|nr:K(+)-stimulated pyrophosphate-energized sodium pump [Candidatus Gugararchaeum adminiculabundum]